jgi:molybdate/tungstate transport system ATP-binding protein
MLDVQQLTIQAGSFRLDSISFQIKSGLSTALMGVSGSGKTTIMEAICGLRHIESGSIRLGDKNITHLRPGERRVALVPQDNALFPHLSVREHLAFGPRIQKWSRAEIKTRGEELAQKLGLTALLDRMPAMLSGGEAKRVAIGRALATRPSLLCLDEALTGLDDKTHAEILQLLKNSIAQERITTLHVTHSRSEAQALSQQTLRIEDLIHP